MMVGDVIRKDGGWLRFTVAMASGARRTSDGVKASRRIIL